MYLQSSEFEFAKLQLIQETAKSECSCKLYVNNKMDSFLIWVNPRGLSDQLVVQKMIAKNSLKMVKRSEAKGAKRSFASKYF